MLRSRLAVVAVVLCLIIGAGVAQKTLVPKLRPEPADGCAWVRVGSDSVLYTVHQLGIARGNAGNMLYGGERHTHVNFGTRCTTGTSDQDYDYCTVGGGYVNAAGERFATVCGGTGNHATGNSATVGGGSGNTASGRQATVAGGSMNSAGGDYAMVPGGTHNEATGWASFAAGRRAKATLPGCFVWGDNYDGDVSASAANSWVVRARGGVYFYTNAGLSTGAYMGAGQNGWTAMCDRTNKEGFTPIDKKALLEQLAQMPLTEYRVKGQDQNVKHVGPVAQDFFEAFGLGETDKGINSMDADGVALAAIQALYEEVQTLRARLAELEQK